MIAQKTTQTTGRAQLGKFARLNDGVLFGGEVIGVFRIHGREVGVLQRPGDAVDGDAFVFVVDLVEQQPVFHAVFRVTEDLLAF